MLSVDVEAAETCTETYRSTVLKRGVFPRPFAVSKLPYRAITMQSVAGEGDFDHYQVDDGSHRI